MRICHFVPEFSIGGIERMLVDIANIQCNYCDVSIVVLKNVIDDDNINNLDNRISFFKINRQPGERRSITDILRLWKTFWHINPDIIHFHTNSACLFPFPFFKKVWTVHNTGLNITKTSLYEKIYSISNAVKQDVLRRSPKLAHKVKLVQNGILISGYRNDKDRQKTRENIKIVQIGRLSIQQKGQDILIKSLPSIISRNGHVKIQLDFIGDGPSKAELLDLCDQLNLTNSVRFIGPRSLAYIRKNLCNYDLLVQPSRFEGFGLTVVEAIAAKVPVLVSSIEGPMEIIDNGRFGFFFENGNINSLINAINEIIDELNGERVKLMISDAYNHIANNYHIENTAKQYLEEYKKLLVEKLFSPMKKNN